MDPLSITTSAVAIITLAANSIAALSRLHELCKTLPGRLYALHNEVADFEAVMNNPNRIEELFTRATIKLTELKSFVEQLERVCRQTRIPLVKARSWQKTQGILQRVQEDLKSIKGDFNILLGSSNSRDLMRIRFDLQKITTNTSHVSEVQNEFRCEYREALAHQENVIVGSSQQLYDQIDQRIGRVEDLIRSQAERMYKNQKDQLGYSYQPPPAYLESHPQQLTDSMGSTSSNKILAKSGMRNATDSSTISVKVTQRISKCGWGCHCACHKEEKTATPTIMNRLFGQLFVGYSGMPLLSPKCDSAACLKVQVPNVSLEYWFPYGVFWSQIISLKVAYQPNIGPQMTLNTLRQVPDTSACVDFTVSGNIEGLKELFRNGMASPKDVSSTRGYSLMRWALYAKQYQTVKFLKYAGGDPDYRPLAAYDNSPRNKAHDFLLQGGLSSEAHDILQCLVSEDDWADDQDFTAIHQAVLGIPGKGLEDMILQHPSDVDTTDAMNRTPLSWAAGRGDDRAVAVLLAYCADANHIDIQLTGPVSYAAQQNHANCVHLLLEAGARTDPELPGGIKVGSALNCASRCADDVMVIKLLLDFNADIEASGVDKKTSLIHVARTGNVEFALLLLEYGADINAVSTSGQSPLTTAITHNSHAVLQLLLDRWFEYSECPRLSGSNLLPTIATYADLKTMQILASTDHLKLKYDRKYSTTGFESTFEERFDRDEKLIEAFKDLLYIINLEPDWKTSTGSLMESGLLPLKDNCDRTALPEHASPAQLSCNSDEEFENALEQLTTDHSEQSGETKKIDGYGILGSCAGKRAFG